jgi:hypothetical protein
MLFIVWASFVLRYHVDAAVPNEPLYLEVEVEDVGSEQGKPCPS